MSRWFGRTKVQTRKLWLLDLLICWEKNDWESFQPARWAVSISTGWTFLFLCCKPKLRTSSLLQNLSHEAASPRLNWISHESTHRQHAGSPADAHSRTSTHLCTNTHTQLQLQLFHFIFQQRGGGGRRKEVQRQVQKEASREGKEAGLAERRGRRGQPMIVLNRPTLKHLYTHNFSVY